MVLGLKAKTGKGPSVQIDYLIHVQEIRPWPPSQSLRSLRAVLLQWENGERSSGSTSPVIPSLGSGIGDGKIEFNESFKVSVTLLRDLLVKTGTGDAFQKNCLEFNLYEPRRDKTVKGQLLGSAAVDLSEYGLLKECLSINVPMNCKRSFRNTAQPVLFIGLQLVDKGRRSSSSFGSPLQKQSSLGSGNGEFVSALLNQKYSEEAEVSSFTDIDVSSHSSLTVASSNMGSPPKLEESGSNSAKESKGGVNEEVDVASEMGITESDMMSDNGQCENQNTNISSSPEPDLSSVQGSPINGHTSLSIHADSKLEVLPQENDVHVFRFSSSPGTSEGADESSSTTLKQNYHDGLTQEFHLKFPTSRNAVSNNVPSNETSISNGSVKENFPNMNPKVMEKLDFSDSTGSEVIVGYDETACIPDRTRMEVAVSTDESNYGSQDKCRKEQQENGHDKPSEDVNKPSVEDDPRNRSTVNMARLQVSSGSNKLSLRSRDTGMRNSILNNDKLKHVKSVRSPLESAKTTGLTSHNQIKYEVTEAGVLEGVENSPKSVVINQITDSMVNRKETIDTLVYGKVQKLEDKIKMLEGELLEAAAIEVALYSVVADHGSSTSKVHAPARRLFRLYLHACKESSQSSKANTARSTVSGLVLVAKACGNDVPRLTFWLSNSVMLRAMITQAIGRQQLPNGGEKGNSKISSSLKWKESSSGKKEKSRNMDGNFGDWESPHIFTSALEKIESWIFSRVIESIWWQTLIPYMQSAATREFDRGMDSGSMKNYQRMPSSTDEEQTKFSLDLWKKAFNDACERICPVRAGGHECSCLPMLRRLIMEQCVARLDVAMCNAILRESSDDMPTDPVSDPISDLKVLPVPAGKSSFGAGAQLKNVIGNWSRWLTDLFGIDDDDPSEEECDECHDNDVINKSSFRPFRLLNALSDLMMLPKDMLLSSSLRKEVCPTFGAPLIKRVLNNFIPDEFCPDPIADLVLDALDSEDDSLEMKKDMVMIFPCNASPAAYLPPSAVSLGDLFGEIGSSPQLKRVGSSALRKSYTSDDELDELDSPLASIITDGSQACSTTPTKPNWASKENGGRNSVRYELLREVWLNSEI